MLDGFVSTNSTVYSAGPPKLVKGSLDYQVAAPHFRSDGSEFLGRYRLIIRSDVARCVYGFTQAPVSARVTVTSANGSSQVATTSVTESSGWITLSADNFTFSNPVIKVVLQQQKLKNLVPYIQGDPAAKQSFSKALDITLSRSSPRTIVDDWRRTIKPALTNTKLITPEKATELDKRIRVVEMTLEPTVAAQTIRWIIKTAITGEVGVKTAPLGQIPIEEGSSLIFGKKQNASR